MKTFMIFLVCGMIAALAVGQPSMPVCGARPTALSQPWISNSSGICLESVIDDPQAGELAFTALAVTPDNVLYATRPLAGEVWALHDLDGDGLPETPSRAAAGLTLPNGLAYHDGALYIVGGAHLYRLRDGAVTTLVDTIPSGGGVWTGGVAIHDGRVYVGVGAPCDGCVFDETGGRGAIWSFDLDGGSPRIEARGLRSPADLNVYDGALWIVDSARDGLRLQANMDELNRLVPGETAHFGFPGCVGAENAPDLDAGIDCTAAEAPILTFPTGSRPLGIAPYSGGALPALGTGFLVALGGTYNETELVGYRVVMVTPTDDGWITRPLTPVDPEPGNPVTAFDIEQINYRGSGLWRHRPYDVTVNEWGWVYISIGGGRILALRPRGE